MFKAVSICLLFVSALLFTGCQSDPHIYNPDANYGNTGGPEMIVPSGGAPIVGGDDWGSTTAVDPSTGGTAIPGSEGAGIPVSSPFSSTPVYFAYDSAVVGTAYDDMLQSLAKYLNDNPSYHLTINGHCDERGSEEYNRALSERRALAVKEAIGGYGAPSDRVNTVGYGEERPAAPGTSADAHAKNRRAEFEVFSK